MKLVLARHGNTFGPDDTPVWVGAREDFALVEKGLEQSCAIGNWLVRADLRPDRIIAGPLLRTLVGADLVKEVTGLSREIEIDDRLKEIDYGSWGGRSDDEIISEWGPDVIPAWREHSIVPEGADWSPAEDVLKTNAFVLLDEIIRDSGDDDVILIVSSNGILRYYHELLYRRDTAPSSAKVKTGYVGLAVSENGLLVPKFWNQDPNAL